MPKSIRRRAALLAGAAAVAAGTVAITAPAAYAYDIYRSIVIPGPNAAAKCQAAGQQWLADGWNGYTCIAHTTDYNYTLVVWMAV